MLFLFAEKIDYFFKCFFWRAVKLVFPDAQDAPAATSQLAKVSQVTGTVFFNLLAPESRGQLVAPLWITKAMPKITVDEDGQLAAGYANVRLTESLFVVLLKMNLVATQFAKNL